MSDCRRFRGANLALCVLACFRINQERLKIGELGIDGNLFELFDADT
jgi:hypothetical protein